MPDPRRLHHTLHDLLGLIGRNTDRVGSMTVRGAMGAGVEGALEVLLAMELVELVEHRMSDDRPVAGVRITEMGQLALQLPSVD